VPVRSLSIAAKSRGRWGRPRLIGKAVREQFVSAPDRRNASRLPSVEACRRCVRSQELERLLAIRSRHAFTDRLPFLEVLVDVGWRMGAEGRNSKPRNASVETSGRCTSAPCRPRGAGHRRGSGAAGGAAPATGEKRAGHASANAVVEVKSFHGPPLRPRYLASFSTDAVSGRDHVRTCSAFWCGRLPQAPGAPTRFPRRGSPTVRVFHSASSTVVVPVLWTSLADRLDPRALTRRRRMKTVAPRVRKWFAPLKTIASSGVRPNSPIHTIVVVSSKGLYFRCTFKARGPRGRRAFWPLAPSTKLDKFWGRCVSSWPRVIR